MVRLSVLAVVIVVCACAAVPALAGPPPVLLGTTSAFSVLAGSGMTNTGVTTLVGDVGSSPTHGQTGFAPCPAADCVNLTGVNHDSADPNDAATQQAKSDLVIAYDDAFGRTGGTAVTAPLGSGQTLVSGVYTAASDMFIGGDLILDAAGDPNAVWIFQAKTGTLVTTAGVTSGIPNTRVLVTNGGQACNVFWQVGSSATISTHTQFLGNVLALQSITVNHRATLDTGRVLARNGAVTLDTNTIKQATCAGAGGGGSTGSGGSTGTPGSKPGSPTAPASEQLLGTARLTGPSTPVSGPFRVTLTGRLIERVRFYVDGRLVRTVRARQGPRARDSPGSG